MKENNFIYESNLVIEGETKWIAPSNNFINVFNEIRHGKALWKLFLILAIVLFLLETWIGRPTTKNMRK